MVIGSPQSALPGIQHQNRPLLPLIESHLGGYRNFAPGWLLKAEGSLVGNHAAYRADVLRGSADLVACPDVDTIRIVFAAAGAMLVTPERADLPPIQLIKGEALYLHSSVGTHLNFPVNSTFLVVSVPQSAIDDAGLNLTAPFGKIMVPDSVLLPSMKYVESVAAVELPEDRMSQHVIQGQLRNQTISLLLTSKSLAESPPKLQLTLYQRAFRLMVAQASDPECSPATLAADLSVSLRNLQRAFSQEGTSVAGMLRKLRVDTAQQLLATPEGQASSLEQIAKRSGFTSRATLQRALRAMESAES